MRWTYLLAVSCALPVAACSSTPPASDTAPREAAVDPAPAVAPDGPRCNPEKVAGYVGKRPTEAVLREAVTASGAKTARVVTPNMAVTMDYREDRLTIEVDDNNRIVRATCG